jgi:hypothetical protein
VGSTRGALLLAATAALAACAPASDPSPPKTGSPAASVAPVASPAEATVPPPAGSVAVDPSLLDVLPEDVEGVAIEPDPVTAESVSRDPELTGKVEAIAIGLAVDAESEGANLAIVNVVRLQPGVFNDAFFRNWRDTYDEAACAQAGGVVGNAEAEIGGRTAYIGSCTGGAHTYHVVARDRVLVSVTAVGEKRLGERIIEGIRA